MAPLAFTVLNTELIVDGEIFPGGEHEIPDASPELHRLVAHAAAGDPDAVSLTLGGDSSGVQSQEDGEAALAEAMGEWDTDAERWTGPWYEGHLEQANRDEAERLRQLAEIEADADEVEGVKV